MISDSSQANILKTTLGEVAQTDSEHREFANLEETSKVKESVVLFDSKTRNDTELPLNAETTYSFFDRSSLEAYARLRQMLQRWVDRVPPTKQKDIAGRMRHKGVGSPREQQNFNGAFFELFLHEFLTGTRGDVTVDPKINGLTPDFGVSEPRHNKSTIDYVVEATDIDVERGTDLELNWNERRALDILNEIESPNFYLSVETDGVLNEPVPMRKLKRPFEELVRNANYDQIMAIKEQHGYRSKFFPSVTVQHRNWSITGNLKPVHPERQPRKERFTGTGPARCDFVDIHQKPKKRLYEKANRYKNIGNLILAVRGELNYFDEVLFGSMAMQITRPTDPTHPGPFPPARTVYQPNGFWFNTKGPLNMHVVGVVVFRSLHPHCIDKATAMFYANPFSKDPLPAWTHDISHAKYCDGEIDFVEGNPPCAFATDYVPWADVKCQWE